MRWPLGRPTTVRTRIVALALAPAVALMALWGFAMVSDTAELRALIRVQGVYAGFGTPVDTAVGQIQIERRMSAAYLGAGGRDAAGAGRLLGQQRRTDQMVDAMRQAIRGGDRGRLTTRQRQSLDAMVTATDRLDGLRQRVLTREISWDRAVEQYSAVIEPTFDVQSTLTALQAGQLARETETVFELVRVREFVSREDALVAGARAAGTALTPGQYDALTQTIEDRRVFQQTYVPDLPADSRALFEKFQDGALYRSLNQGEDALLRAGAGGASRAVAADSWRSTVDRIVKQYRDLCTAAADNSAARGRAFAYQQLTRAAIAGAAGLVVAGLSLWFAVRGARRISRRLEALRDAADVLAGRQLPDVMRRLSAGEEVDALAEAPPLAAAGDRDDEIGQVGRSFNTARLAAVEAAVRQATLRRGLFAVLLNIARRNQALVHRQLKLVDTLERRTEDPDVLRELFRIDHLTTRMRRHAESLIILSGSAPGRRWRRPVPIAQVVSSAVGEIEDYARVVVPPMPDTGIAADAVADVVHLVAELLENATVFSPPHTQVTLRTGRVGGGFVLEIDDRGLGLDAEAHAHAERTLTDPDAFDPTRHDRLGLYVVGRLAARHGIDVSLRDSPYGGTTAVVLLPETILAATGETDTRPEPEPTAAPPAAPTGVWAGHGGPGHGGPGHGGAGHGGAGRGGAGRGGARVPLPSEERGEVRPLPSGGVRPLPSRRRNGPAEPEAPPTGAPGVAPHPSAQPGPLPTRGSGPSVGGTPWRASYTDHLLSGPGDASHPPAQPGSRPAERPRAAESATPWHAPHGSSSTPGPGAPAAPSGGGPAASAPPPLPTRRPGGHDAPGQPPHTPTAGPGAPASTPPPPLPARRPGPSASADAWQPPHASTPGHGASASAPPPPLPTRRHGAPDGGVPAEAAGAAPVLPTRVRQASLARQLRDEPQDQAKGGRREVDAEEMRAIFGAFQRGLDQGRKGMPARPARPGATDGDTVNIHVDEGTDTDDAR
ncbi:nitrate- and nitrite sensing domain-containing protein [Streptomyces sp. PsTaAH-130]|uniref:sensor histidine kinase n=2 Tax=Streptomyces TaxID=1883 RepID=UPI000DC5738E|nr:MULTISPECIES: nitrate- and nitrite sensing domain-containing protein [unclassified Streptomyces]RAJ50969.1 signal transduction histidine kinase [Streptomyces sp. PsTaAH-130]